MLKLDPSELLRRQLRTPRALKTHAPDSPWPYESLYPSMDLLGSLRHTMLRVAGAPVRQEEDILSLIRMETGTLWHDQFDKMWRSSQLPVMLETRLTDYMPEGWSGRADWINWSDQYKAFVLSDLKTIKPEGMGWIRRDGIKDSHLWQLSAYWYALEKMGLPLVKVIHVYYLPMGPIQGTEAIKPEFIEAVPLDRDLVLGTMVDRAAQTKRYLEALPPWSGIGDVPDYFLNEHLAPVQEREQALRWDKAKGIFDLKLLPNWSTTYCSYPAELCDCHTQGQTKIGEYRATWDTDIALAKDVFRGTAYVPRKGYENIIPKVALTKANIDKLKEAHAASSS